jgi:hypothetical protein
LGRQEVAGEHAKQATEQQAINGETDIADLSKQGEDQPTKGLPKDERSANLSRMVKAMDERSVISDVVDRLTQKYSEVSPGTVAEVVHDLHLAFAGAPLREFVPLFVERRARTALDELSVPYG